MRFASRERSECFTVQRTASCLRSKRFIDKAFSVVPVKKDIVRREYCRDYAFCIHKVERAHIGIEPKKYTYEEQKNLSKIERCINKLLRKSQKNTPQKVCKDNLFDAIRYTAPRYGYKRRFLNKERADWELIFLILFGVLALVAALMIWLIGKLV